MSEENKKVIAVPRGEFIATQWFKLGDHPNDEIRPGTSKEKGNLEYIIDPVTQSPGFVIIEPSNWIVEWEDTRIKYTDKKFQQRFKIKSAGDTK